jgi:hypothetical protein
MKSVLKLEEALRVIDIEGCDIGRVGEKRAEK